MKKIISLILAFTMLAVSAVLFAGCSEKKDAATEAPQVTEAPAQQTEAAVLDTVVPDELETLAGQDVQETEFVDAPVQGGGSSAYTEGSYGGLTGEEAILKAISYAGAGYHCIYYAKRYLRNQEAWYLGLQADGSNYMYFAYVNDNSCAPVTEIPNIGGNNTENSGVFSVDYAGVCEQEAIFRALELMEPAEYVCLYTEQTLMRSNAYWKIAIQEYEKPSSEILYIYVNADSCFQQ